MLVTKNIRGGEGKVNLDERRNTCEKELPDINKCYQNVCHREGKALPL
jgi:hypothetical protein